MAGLTRRKTLQLLASLGSFSMLPAVRWASAASVPPELARFEDSLELRAATRLGRDYLARHPDEANADRILMHINGGEPPTPERLSAAVREDFAHGRVVDLRDWQVSVTEARIFSLLALTA